MLFPRIPDFEDLRRCVRRIMEPMRIILPIIVGLVCAVVFFFVGVLYRKKVAEKEIGSAEEESKRIICLLYTSQCSSRQYQMPCHGQ